ncbi:MAG TPA: hypothetical protein VD931_05945, partial [Baekduia sp.]|nr:hypothetical protein [Baekduia sp.]
TTDDRLLAPVLSRVVGMLAARANFPVDRLDDALLLSDAIAAHGPGQFDGPWTRVTVSTADDGLRMEVGPLRQGGPEAMLQAAVLPQIGNVFERIADEVRTQDRSLHLRVAAR